MTHDNFTLKTAALLLIVGYLILAPWAWGVNQYVWPGGDNSTGADYTHAWNTISSITGESAGDTVYIAGGTYTTIHTCSSGSADNSVVYKRATTLRHGTSTGWDNSYDSTVWIIPSSTAAAFTITGKQWIEFDGVDSSKFIILGNSGGQYGFYGDSLNRVRPNHLTFKNITIKNMRSGSVNCGIRVRNFGTGVNINHCEISNCGSGGPEDALIILQENLPTDDSVFIQYNWLHDVGEYALSNGDIIIYDKAYHAVIENNCMMQDSADGGSMDFIFLVGSHCRISNNIMWAKNDTNDNQWVYIFSLNTGIFSPHDDTIYNNVMYKPPQNNASAGDKGNGIPIRQRTGSSIKNIIICNNTIYGQNYCCRIDSDDLDSIQNIKYYNNYFRKGSAWSENLEAVDDFAKATFDLNGNYYDQDVASPKCIKWGGTSKTLAAVQSDWAWEADGLAGTNPSFNGIAYNTLYPTFGSDLIDVGITDPGDGFFNTDILGITRPKGAGWDIGAYEYNTDNFICKVEIK